MRHMGRVKIGTEPFQSGHVHAMCRPCAPFCGADWSVASPSFRFSEEESLGGRERERVAWYRGETDFCENLEAVETELCSCELQSALPLAFPHHAKAAG